MRSWRDVKTGTQSSRCGVDSARKSKAKGHSMTPDDQPRLAVPNRILTNEEVSVLAREFVKLARDAGNPLPYDVILKGARRVLKEHQRRMKERG